MPKLFVPSPQSVTRSDPIALVSMLFLPHPASEAGARSSSLRPLVAQGGSRMPEPMELAYEERGSGPVLLFVHGFPFDRTMWIAQLAGLAKVRTTVAVDLRGHGLSNAMSGSDFSMDLFADDIAKTLDVIGADQADLAGLSMGGYVLFAFWRRHPDRVRSLIFIDTKAEADGDEAKAGREKTAEMVAAQGLQPLYDSLGPKLVGSSPSIEVQDKIKSMI